MKFKAVIAPKVVPNPTFTGEPQTHDQKYEVSERLRKTLAMRQVNSKTKVPFVLDHDLSKVLGEMGASYLREDGKWAVDFSTDETTELGKKATDDIKTGKMRAVSLSHMPLSEQIRELSLCKVPARPGACIHAVMDTNTGKYIPVDDETPINASVEDDIYELELDNSPEEEMSVNASVEIPAAAAPPTAAAPAAAAPPAADAMDVDDSPLAWAERIQLSLSKNSIPTTDERRKIAEAAARLSIEVDTKARENAEFKARLEEREKAFKEMEEKMSVYTKREEEAKASELREAEQTLNARRNQIANDRLGPSGEYAANEEDHNAIVKECMEMTPREMDLWEKASRTSKARGMPVNASMDVISTASDLIREYKNKRSSSATVNPVVSSTPSAAMSVKDTPVNASAPPGMPQFKRAVPTGEEAAMEESVNASLHLSNLASRTGNGRMILTGEMAMNAAKKVGWNASAQQELKGAHVDIRSGQLCNFPSDGKGPVGVTLSDRAKATWIAGSASLVAKGMTGMKPEDVYTNKAHRDSIMNDFKPANADAARSMDLRYGRGMPEEMRKFQNAGWNLTRRNLPPELEEHQQRLLQFRDEKGMPPPNQRTDAEGNVIGSSQHPIFSNNYMRLLQKAQLK